MIIWMRNPKHGRMPVYSHTERDQAIVHGWHEETPEEVPGAKPPEADEPKKRGRPRKQ